MQLDRTQPLKSRIGSFLRLLAVCVVAAVVASCATQEGVRYMRARDSAYVSPQSSSLSVDQEAQAAELCPAGPPQHRGDFNPGPTEFIVRRGYALEFSNDLKIPLWVCEHVFSMQLNGSEERKDKFRPDPLLKGPHSELSDYKNSHYDRGHQAPSGDQDTDATLNSETFYLSNMAPQVPAFNEQVWKGVETQARKWAVEFGDVWIITGGLIYDPKEDTAATATGWAKYSVIGANGVAVPTHFYKIVARKSDNRWEAIAFILENRKYASPYDFASYLQSIQFVENKAGLVFLPSLDEATAQQLKSTTPALWH